MIFCIYIQIADDLRPHPMVISVLTKLTRIIPTWKIIPTQDIIDAAFRVPEVREEVYIFLFNRAEYVITILEKSLKVQGDIPTWSFFSIRKPP